MFAMYEHYVRSRIPTFGDILKNRNMIGLISAMPQEIQSLLDQMDRSKSYIKGQRRYYTGILYGKEVVLAFSRWGKVAAATTATQMINDFELSELIFTGVAGGIHPELNIGDIVVGNRLVQHDMNAAPLYDPLMIPLLDKMFFETSSNRRDELVEMSNDFLNQMEDYILSEESLSLGIDSPKVHVGDIASGDQFVATHEQAEAISKKLPDVLCVEMEGAAVAQVCHEYDTPFSIIRIISDNADTESHVDFPVFVEKVARKYSLGIFKRLLSQM